MDERGNSFANGASNSQGSGGFDYDTGTGRPDPEMHWWFMP